jgi:Stigma-specific protein, Stig1
MKLKATAWLVVLLLFGCDKSTSTGVATGSAGSATGSAEVAGEDDEPEQAGSAQSWKAGDVVQVKHEGKWHEAEIVTAGSTYKVIYTFADTVEDNVDAARIRKPKWSKKTHVEAQVGDAWKLGTVVARHGHGDYSYDIALDGGATQTFTAAQVRGLRKPKTAAAPASSASSNSGASAPCPAPAYIMRCGGSCIDTHEDFNNCGSCGHRCQSGGRCDSGFCRDKQGDH